MYKFRDYYSVFADPARYITMSPDRVLDMGVVAAATQVEERFRTTLDLPRIKEKTDRFVSVRLAADSRGRHQRSTHDDGFPSSRWTHRRGPTSRTGGHNHFMRQSIALPSFACFSEYGTG